MYSWLVGWPMHCRQALRSICTAMHTHRHTSLSRLLFCSLFKSSLLRHKTSRENKIRAKENIAFSRPQRPLAKKNKRASAKYPSLILFSKGHECVCSMAALRSVCISIWVTDFQAPISLLSIQVESVNIWPLSNSRNIRRAAFRTPQRGTQYPHFFGRGKWAF